MSLFPELDETPGGRAPSAPSSKKRGPAPPVSEGPYLALARKYRPDRFEEVVGQEAAVATLKNTITSGRLHHAYLFSGIRGVGKTTAARLFARALNCVKGPTTEPCGACDACREIGSSASMDVIEIDAASNRGVDDVEPLREAARYAPSRDRYKIFILDEVHMLSNAAFNSLLKILEEPPPRVVWILATTEYRKVPSTVVSRCQHFEFRRVSRADVGAYLARIAKAERVEIDPEGVEIIASAAGGSVRDAVSLLDQCIAYAGAKATAEDVRSALGVIDRRLLVEFLRLVAARDAKGLIDLIASLAEGGVEFSQFAAGLLSTARDAALLRFAGAGTRAVALTQDDARELSDLASGLGEDGLLRVFNAALDLPYALRGSPQPRFVMEAAALRLARIADLAPIEEVIARLQSGPASAATGSAPRGTEGSAGSPRSSLPSSSPGSPGGAGATSSASSSASPGADPAGAAPPPAGDSAIDEEPPQPAEGDSGAGGEVWRARFLSAAQARKLSLRTSLEAASRILLAGDVVSIVMPGRQRFLRETLETPESRALLEQAATEVAGRPVRVTISTDAPAAGAAASAEAPPAGAGKRERLLDAALKQPQVRRLMETFGGQVVDIQEMP